MVSENFEQILSFRKLILFYFSDPMRITKKFAGNNCIGKQVFHPCENNEVNNAMRKESMAELDRLERIFRARVYSKAHSISERYIRNYNDSHSSSVPQQSPNTRGIKHKQNPCTEVEETTPYVSPRKNSKEYSPESAASSSANTSMSAMTDSIAGLTSLGDSSFSSSSSSNGVFQKNKRVMSAPDLTQLSLLATVAPLSSSAQDDSTSSISRLSSSYSAVDDYMQPPGIAFASQTSPFTSSTRKSPHKGGKEKSKSVLPNTRSGANGGRLRSNSQKKSHSVMDLVNYEKLAADDHLAGE